MTDGFIATVVSINPDKTYLVKPKIIEHDGTDHLPITVSAVEGITALPKDEVLVVTIRNNQDNKPIQRYFDASEACGRIIAVSKSTDGIFRFTGEYTFIINEMMLNIMANTINQLPDIIQQATQRTAFSDNYLTPVGPCISRIPGGLP